MYEVYVLKSLKDNKYYIGQTDNMQRRMLEHNEGRSRSTKNRRPFILIGCESYNTRSEARFREYKLKNSIEKQAFIKKLISDPENKKYEIKQDKK